MIRCNTCGKTGHKARDCPCFRCGKVGHWAKNCPGTGNKLISKKSVSSPFNINEYHQVHSQGWTLSRTPIHRILRGLRPDADAAELNCGCHDRDPIAVETFLQLFEAYQQDSAALEEMTVDSDGFTPVKCRSKHRRRETATKYATTNENVHSDKEEVEEVLGKWLTDIVEDPQTQLQQPGMRKVCIPFLVGDCFNHRAGRFCQAGRHLILRCDPLSHALVTGTYEGEAGMMVRLVLEDEVLQGGESPGQVKGAPILGYSDGEILIGEERDLWQKACNYPTGCRRVKCRYAHEGDYR